MIKPNTLSYSWLSRFKNGIWKPHLMSIDLLLKRYFEKKISGKLVQIGSNDGISNDPLRQYLISGDWKAILVEPIPHIFEKLKSNYNELIDRVNFENSIVSSEDGFEHFFSIKKKALKRYPNYADQLGSLSLDVLLKLKSEYPEVEEDIEKLSLPSITFDSLIKKYNFEGIDLIHIDAEGNDDKIISTIEIASYRPDILLFEHIHMSERIYQEILNNLKKRKYRMYYYGFDTIAISHEILEQYPEIGKMNLI